MQFDVDRTDAKRIEEVGGVHVLDIIKLSYHTSVCGTVLSADVEKAFCLIPVASYRDQQGVQPPRKFGTYFSRLIQGREKGFCHFSVISTRILVTPFSNSPKPRMKFKQCQGASDISTQDAGVNKTFKMLVLLQ